MKWAAGNDALERLRRSASRTVRRLREELLGERKPRGFYATTSTNWTPVDRTARSRKARSSDADRVGTRTRRERLERRDGARTEEVSARTKALVKERAALEHAAGAVDAERAAASRLREQQSQHEAEAAQEEARLKTHYASHAPGAGAEREALAAIDKAERTLRGVQSGTGAGGDGDKSLQTQLADAVAAVAEAETRGKNAAMRRKHCEKELALVRKKLKQSEAKGSALAEAASAAEAAFAKARGAHEAHPGFAAGSNLGALEQESETAESAVRSAQERVDVLNGQLAGLDFKFADPEAKFDRRRVRGVVATLMRVADPATATALEVVAGGKLFQVVVDTEVTGKALLAKGKLAKRVTIVPLNKIDGRAVSESQIAAAARASDGDARLALSLVTYDDDVKNVMAYVFGKAFVCKDAATARAVAFDKDVLTNCVTVEGDLLNPGGLLTGGSRRGGSVLAKLHALHDAECVLENATRVHAAAIGALAEAKSLVDAAHRLETAADQAEHALKLAREKLAGSEAASLASSATALEEACRAAAAEGADADAAKAESMTKRASLTVEIESFANEREQRLERAMEDVKAAKTALASARADVKAAETATRDAAVARGAAAAERASIEETISNADDMVMKLETEHKACESLVLEAQTQLDIPNAALNERKAKAANLSRRFAETKAKLAALAKSADADAVARKQLEHKMSRAAKASEDTEASLARLHEDHPWVESESHLFGKDGGEYDFARVDAAASAAELEKREAAQASVAKRVNKKVIAMFDKAESEFKQLQEKRRIVLEDRGKIEAVIHELDEKKKEALRVTWTKVNADFGSIFSTLLTSASAKLEPPEGESFLDGLEVKVSFGGVWKESLTELSGGQRSLLALSLILALLLFKPAPIYILDEVDAALDLSHTQNIGRMIRAHFPFSQFIVVSLKEGMFNNANSFPHQVRGRREHGDAHRARAENREPKRRGRPQRCRGVSDGPAAGAQYRARQRQRGEKEN